MDASDVFWWIGWAALFAADFRFARRRLAPYLIVSALVALVNASNVEALFGVPPTATLARFTGLLHYLLPGVLGVVASRIYRDDRYLRYVSVALLASAPLAVAISFDAYTWMLGVAWISMSFALLVAVFHQANLGQRLPTASDVNIVLLAMLELVAYSVVLGDRLGQGSAVVESWSSIAYLNGIVMGVGATLHLVSWKTVVQRLG